MSFKRFTLVLTTAFLMTASLFAQDATKLDELRTRVEQLEKRIAEMQQNGSSAELDELKRQIEVLTREIESLKVDQAPPAPDTPQYGLGAAASKVYKTDHGVSIGGYGEMLYENTDANLDNGERVDEPSQIDFLRGVLYTGYKFSDRALFNSELEVEHAKVEGDEGEVALEFAYLDFLIRPQFNVRAGLVLVPMGLVNEQHEPTAYLGTHRPEVERVIIPSTWRENGVGAFGDFGKFSYRTFIVNSLNAEGFDAEEGIREGRGEGGEALAEDFAWVGRVDYHPFEGTLFGGAIYTGDTSHGRRTPSGERFNGRVTVTQLHADSKIRGLSLRALWAGGALGDARQVNEFLGVEGDEGIGKSFSGWYAEAGYDFGALFNRAGALSLTPYVRYENFDTQKSVPTGFERNAANRGTVLTTGIAWKPIPQAVVKADYDNFDRHDDSGLDRFSISLGYIF